MGPGLRSAVWVQGCPFKCKGCISPQWVPIKKTHLVPVEVLVAELLFNPFINGFTFSGGEPFLQAKALAELIRQAKRKRDISLICYTGYSLDELKTKASDEVVSDLLAQIDVLIAGPYIDELNDNRGLRGSSNQIVHHLTDRLKYYDFISQPRNAEIQMHDGEMLFVGVPPIGVYPHFTQDNGTQSRPLKQAS